MTLKRAEPRECRPDPHDQPVGLAEELPPGEVHYLVASLAQQLVSLQLLNGPPGVRVLAHAVGLGDGQVLAPVEVDSADELVVADVHLQFRWWQAMVVKRDPSTRFQHRLGAVIAESYHAPRASPARPARA